MFKKRVNVYLATVEFYVVVSVDERCFAIDSPPPLTPTNPTKSELSYT